MGITQIDMLTGLDKEETAIALIQAFEPPDGFDVADSGGKDSGVVVNLTLMAEVKHRAVHYVSPVDPPEVRLFLKSHRPNTVWEYHARGFWGMVARRGLPRRQGRWCCEVIKEGGGKGKTVIVGNRASESTKRSKQKCFSQYKDKVLLRPIINWTTGEVWEYHRKYNLPYCSLYDDGFTRIGCVMCPMATHTNRMIEMERFPKIANLWRLSCDHIVERRKATGKTYKREFETGQELWDWWIN